MPWKEKSNTESDLKCSLRCRLPCGLESQVIEGELQESGVLTEGKVLGGSATDVVD